MDKTKNKKGMMTAILSLSLLTVMGFEHLPFCFAVFLAAILTAIAFFMRKAEK